MIIKILSIGIKHSSVKYIRNGIVLIQSPKNALRIMHILSLEFIFKQIYFNKLSTYSQIICPTRMCIS